MRVGQRIRTDFLRAALQPGVAASWIMGMAERKDSETELLKLVLCLSVAEQFKDTDSQH